jgi:class 3 adenylate cyclase
MRHPQAGQDPNRAAQARHDLRNPIGEIIGFADILEEEAADPGHAGYRRTFAAIRSAARELLERLEATLSDRQVREDPGSVHALKDLFLERAARIRDLAAGVALEGAVLPGRPFVEDLARVVTAAEHLVRTAPILLDGWQDAAGGVVGQPAPPTRADPSPAGSGPIPDGAASSRTTGPVQPGARILVVDDNEANRALLERRLLRDGHTILHAGDGEEALVQLRRHPVDLVLLDVLMPRMTGREVLRVMKADASLRHLPVILISGLDDIDSLVDGIEGGAEDYLTKPFDPVLLRARIGASLERKRLRDSEQDLLRRVREEQQKSETLLLNILPPTIAERLKSGESTIVDTFAGVSVLFADLAGFTGLSTRISGADLVRLLDGLFTTFDLLAQRQGIEKIKTIGDAYMAVAGLPLPRPDHAQAAAELALDMVAAVRERFSGGPHPVRIRIGISSGPVVAGVIGRHKFSYDLWGDTVNTASRMESHGEPDAIQVSDETRRLLADQYRFTRRDLPQVKGKGDLTAWILTGRHR